MNQEQFVAALRTEVLDTSATDVVQQLRKPAGRRPPENLRRLSAWFQALPDSDKAAVADVARLVSHQAVFGFLCVLDGVRAIEDESDKGSLAVIYRKGELEVPLNGPGLDLLHDLLNAE